MQGLSGRHLAGKSHFRWSSGSNRVSYLSLSEKRGYFLKAKTLYISRLIECGLSRPTSRPHRWGVMIHRWSALVREISSGCAMWQYVAMDGISSRFEVEIDIRYIRRASSWTSSFEQKKPKKELDHSGNSTLPIPSKQLDVCALPPRLVLKLLFGPGAEKRITEKPPQHLGFF